MTASDLSVLLVSPRLPAGHPQYGGDNAYTDTLLAYPPPGVRYRHYEDLLADGRVRRIKWLYRTGPRLRKWGILPPDLWAEYLSSDFVPDLVHIVGFSAVVRFPGAKARIPVVVEAPSGSVSGLQAVWRWPEDRIRRAQRVKRAYLRLIGAYDSNLTSERAAQVIVQSEHSRRLHLQYGGVRPDKLRVLPPPIPPAPVEQPIESRSPLTFLFVGGDFERKNGQMVVDAFQQVRAGGGDVRLILVSRPRDGRTIEAEGVSHYPGLPRRTLFEQVYPQADVLLLPSGAEGGFGVVVFEAMSFGLAVITVDAWAMREIVDGRDTGLLIPFPPRAETLVDAMGQVLADPGRLLRMRQAAREAFRTRFAPAARQARLGAIYREVLENGRGHD